ncbi:MAG: CPBP family intramembrane metalloprotease [Actinomycetota bacterium]|nr:CPBP family intramembrane metalloprotease [Actinomycetota bacterium]
MTARTLGAFFGWSFGLSWGLMALAFMFPDQLEQIFGPVGYTNPLFIIAVYAPAISGLVLVGRFYGISGVGSFLRRLTMWRMPARYWAFIGLGIPVIFYLGAAIIGHISDPFPFTPWYKVLPALATALAIGPMEEFGWRGVALPLLQRRLAPIWASIILGAVWGLWHVPAFFLSGTPQSAWSFGPFLLGTMAVSVVLTQIFNSARGSLLVAALFHFQLNSPVWPDAQPWDSIIFALIAVVFVVLNRKGMFTRSDSVSEVLAPAAP